MNYFLGIDIGSTTVKLVLADEHQQVHYKSYRRHYSRTVETVLEELKKIVGTCGDKEVSASITGSGGIELAQESAVPFVQEVFATSAFVDAMYPDTSVVIELGGEDAKIIFFGANTEERMNGSCAGGTGAFIDQMASLLHVTVEELDQLSLQADSVYPIASRCGVFAKSDIQPLLNQGASKENISASVYRAVVDQTIGGLAGGRPIKGKVLFLGGPLTFCKGLQKAFCTALPEIQPVLPPDSEYFVAFGAAFYAAGDVKPVRLSQLIETLRSARETLSNNRSVCPPLFSSEDDYHHFQKRHQRSSVAMADHPENSLELYLGIDAGSTTTKMVAINRKNELVFTAYRSNAGDPISTVREQLNQFYEAFPKAKVGCAMVTGYGEDLIRSAFHADGGVVETVAHYTAAQFFEPDVDFIIDIGGQDMKCFGIRNRHIERVILNEACSSGCGSFLQSFAQSMGCSMDDFSRMALFAKRPADLGSRCTVFMNSSVKQAQKNGATLADIAAGLCISVGKNALFKVLRVNDIKQLGKKIVVQGGTFQNDAVLRSFEQEIGGEVIRPSIAGLMGAFGAAKLAAESGIRTSRLLNREAIQSYQHTSLHTRCRGCENRCALTVNQFLDGSSFISGNRCSKPTGGQKDSVLPNLYQKKQAYLSQYFYWVNGDITIGIPLVLNFYDTLPFWVPLLVKLGFSVRVSGFSTRQTFQHGQHTIPSDTICYGAKLVHGHILKLLEYGVDAIFYPCMSYNFEEEQSDNHFHCPVVAYYPEVIAANVREVQQTEFLNGFLDLNHSGHLAQQLLAMFQPLNSRLTKKKVLSAISEAREELERYRRQVKIWGEEALTYAKEHHKKAIVLAGRPYHVDPELNHGIDQMINGLDFVVLSEDALPLTSSPHPQGVLNQWTYHSRMYHAAQQVTAMEHTELVQLISFGCGLDAVTSDEVREILEQGGKLYTGLKIDEINNLGAAKIRIRSLLAAMEERSKADETHTV